MNLHIRFSGLITAAGVLACLATVLGFTGTFWWVFELAVHFRVQYALALGVCAIVLSWMRRWRWATVFGAFALINAATVAPAFWSDSLTVPTAHKTSPTMRALLANVNVDNRDHERIRQTIVKFDPDFVVLLETTPWLLDQLRDLNERYPHRTTEPRDDPFGIAIFSRLPFSSTRIIRLSTDGPPVITAVVAAEHPFTLVGVHPWPPISTDLAQGRNDQLHELAHLAHRIPTPLLVLGDLNTSPWSPWFNRLLIESNLHDSLRGRGIQPSWPVGQPLLWTPLDHVLFSDGIHMLRREVGPAIGSDHYPVVVEFQVVGS